jgi:hypothetical protein
MKEQFGSCIDGKGIVQSHFAEGWIISPQGKPIAPMCADHAKEVIDEYREKLGVVWTFDGDR